MHLQHVLLVIKASFNGDLAVVSLFERVFCEVYQHLLESYFIADELLGKALLLHFEVVFDAFRGKRTVQFLHAYKFQRAVYHLDLRREHVQYEFKDVSWIESL